MNIFSAEGKLNSFKPFSTFRYSLLYSLSFEHTEVIKIWHIALVTVKIVGYDVWQNYTFVVIFKICALIWTLVLFVPQNDLWIRMWISMYVCLSKGWDEYYPHHVRGKNHQILWKRIINFQMQLRCLLSAEIIVNRVYEYNWFLKELLNIPHFFL